MSMIPSSFGEMSFVANNFNSSNFSHQYGFVDPFSVAMYWQETAFVLSANVHGLSGEQVKVEIRDRRVFLIFCGGENYGGHCIKSCQLPNNVNVKNSTADINNGVLTVKLPKENKEKKQKAPVQVPTYYGRRGSFFC